MESQTEFQRPKMYKPEEHVMSTGYEICLNHDSIMPPDNEENWISVISNKANGNCLWIRSRTVLSNGEVLLGRKRCFGIFNIVHKSYGDDVEWGMR